jgi:hypothetical protein
MRRPGDSSPAALARTAVHAPQSNLDRRRTADHSCPMSWITEPPLAVVHRRGEASDVDERRLQRHVRCGDFVRIARGSFVATTEWAALTPIQKHAQRVWEAAARMSPGRVYSQFSAAAVLGIDLLGAWPMRIDVSGEGLGGSSGSIRRHERDLDSLAVIPWFEHFLTTPAQTAIDLAAALPFVQGVAAADQALWRRRPGGALTTPAELDRVATGFLGRAHARVHRVTSFARPGADSVRESESRVLIARLGFPEPELQHRFVLSDERVAYTDFWWPDFSHVGEFDGVGKYLDPALRDGRSADQVLIEEKDRADELRRQVRALSRWRTPALRSPRLLYDILTGDGLPSFRPRPGR